MDDLKSPRIETKRKVIQLNYILSSISNFVLRIIYIATFRNSVVVAHSRTSGIQTLTFGDQKLN